jgi:high-affinity K+ transport system ATPase subunit B
VPLLNSATTFHVPTWLGVNVLLASPLTILTVLVLATLLLGSIHLNLTLVISLFLVVALAVILSPRLITPSDGLLPSYNVNE